jgi:hypothetical protein
MVNAARRATCAYGKRGRVRERKARQVRSAVRRAVVYHKRTGDSPNRGEGAGM